MGNYSIGNLLQKEPVVIAGAIRSVLWVLVLLGVVALGEAQLAGIALALELVLTLFARQSSTPTAAPALPLGKAVTVEGTADGPPPDAVVARREDVVEGSATDLELLVREDA